MITPEEIQKKSEEFEINISAVQRDYILGWFLSAVFTETALKDKFFLKGGNALRKCYFENTRYSGDIDFGMHGDLEPQHIIDEINRACGLVQKKIDVTFDLTKTIIKEQHRFTPEDDKNNLKIFEAKIYFQDFYSFADHIILKIEMDITRFDMPLLEIQHRPLIHPYSDASELSNVFIPVMKAEEILATKLKCLLQREHAPDLFDVVYPEIFNPGYELNKQEVVSTFLRKTIFEHSPAVVREILLETPFDFFRQYWKDVICSKSSRLEVEIAIDRFILLIKDLFKDYPESYFDHGRFFGPKIRNPIMKAARQQTILKITYDGYERKVEPYSLKYLQPKGKSQQEYLFVWNVEGGRQSIPGLRMFLPGKIENIENTEEKFTPQRVIELCKAGEHVEDPYLYDRNKAVQEPYRKSIGHFSQANSEKKYTIECTVCHKRFKRSERFNTSLNDHKNQKGYLCYGTYGRCIF